MSDLEGAGGRGEHFQVKQKQTSSIKTEEEDEEEEVMVVVVTRKGSDCGRSNGENQVVLSVLKTVTRHCGSGKTQFSVKSLILI